MIYVLNLNPSVDYDINVANLTKDDINQAKIANFRASGKGVNVAKMLRKLGIKCTLLGFIGGFTGDFITDEMRKCTIRSYMIEIAGTTRINVKLNVNGVEHEITGLAPEIPKEGMDRLYKQLAKAEGDDWVVFSGSIPPCLPQDIYRTLAQALPSGVNTVLDTRGGSILQNVYKNTLLKPNLSEFRQMFPDDEITTDEQIAEKSKLLFNLGVEKVIVTKGGQGAVFVSKHEFLSLPAPTGTVINTMGSGDSVVAGFLSAKLKDFSDIEAFKLGVACGSATAFSVDMGEQPLIKTLYESI